MPIDPALQQTLVDNMAGIPGEYTGFFATIGVLSFSYIALRALYAFWRIIKSYLIGSGVDVKSLGEWAGMGHFKYPQFIGHV